jgi:hypothetical protein
VGWSSGISTAETNGLMEVELAAAMNLI